MCDLKFSLLLKLQRYTEAKKFLDKIKKVLPFEDAKIVSVANNADILKKKLSLKEKMDSLNIVFSIILSLYQMLPWKDIPWIN